MLLYVVAVVVVTLLTTTRCHPLSSRTVRTKYGDLAGVIVTFDQRHLDPVEVFRGVPYASPPVGSLRFMPPVSGALWSGVRQATKFSPVCVQRVPDISNETVALKQMPRGRFEYLKRLLPYLSEQSEDCLYLNIYAPAQAGSRDRASAHKYPVMVFIHGESYEWNSGNPYDGSVLASYGGVVVVTVNYRLGILGFLNANNDPQLRSPANYGLMDQIAALHWLQENIAMFGGDPTNVTIVGHGTGGACVNLLMTSDAVPEGLLFHRAVLMSGSALSPWALVENPAHYAQIVARSANCSPDLSTVHLLKCLRDRPLESLLAAPVVKPDFSSAFGPSIDGVVIDIDDPPQNTGNSDRFGSEPLRPVPPSHRPSPLNVLLRRSVISRLSRYDVMMGVVKAESYFTFTGDDVQYGIEADRRAKILRSFVRNTYRYHLSEILATIVNEYTDWERPVQHPINIRDETLEALGDAQVVAPIVHTADLHSAARRNSYLYVFDYQTKFGDYPQRQGCVHGEELPYVFGAPLVGGLGHYARNYTKAEVALSEAVMIYWSNFARTGNPNEPQEPDVGQKSRFKNIEWTAYEAVHKKYINLDTKPKVKTHYRAHRLSFWLNLVPDLHRPGDDDVPDTHHRLLEDDVHPRPPPPPPPPLRTEVPFLAAAVSTVSGEVNASIAFSSTVAPSVAEIENSVVAGASASPPQPEDGFAAYSTALSVTIAIGCSLLILNVVIFAGVYYQRDKTRLHSADSAAAADGKKPRAENGQMPNNICGDLLMDGGVNKVHHHHHRHTHVLPPQTTPLPRPPPPPRAKPEAQPLLANKPINQTLEELRV